MSLRLTACALLLTSACASLQAGTQERPASSLPDLSGLVWMSGDLFLGVHDAKNDADGARKELGRPRVSLVWAPTSEAGVRWRPLPVEWPATGGPSNDLESAARIPGTQQVLLVESGDDGARGTFRRLFLAELAGERVQLLESVPWPAPVRNVEASAVARVGDRLVFAWAERSHGSATTELRWAPLQRAPLRFGAIQQVRLEVPASHGFNRPVVALDVDSAGRAYVAASFDPDDDNGPFSSGIFRVGRFEAGPGGEPTFAPEAQPALLATVSGSKVESVAVREGPGGAVELFYGTDDENYGAVLRRVVPKEPDGEGPGLHGGMVVAVALDAAVVIPREAPPGPRAATGEGTSSSARPARARGLPPGAHAQPSGGVKSSRSSTSRPSAGRGAWPPEKGWGSASAGSRVTPRGRLLPPAP
jgi:hypothetical protein